MISENFFGTRHSLKPSGEDEQSENYKGISEFGVELARERAADILEIMKNEPEGTIMFLAGASEISRTKNTAKIYSEEIDKILTDSDNEEISLISKNDIVNIANEKDVAGEKPGYTEIATKIAEEIKTNPDKKYIIDLPMFIKEFEFGNNRWTDKNGNFTEYLNQLIEKHGRDINECLKDWIKNEGKLKDMSGPNPTEMAKEQLQGIKRLAEFADRYLEGDRNLIIGFVGHSWTMDALAVYLTNNGVVDIAGFNKIGGQVIAETQMMRVGKNKEDKSCLFYNNEEYGLG
jgi:hypothetical protein